MGYFENQRLSGDNHGPTATYYAVSDMVIKAEYSVMK